MSTRRNHTILILGATGMLGHVLFRNLLKRNEFDVYGTVRSADSLAWFPSEHTGNIHAGVRADSPDTIADALSSIQPDSVINCIGLVKQSPLGENRDLAMQLNALLPHRIASICGLSGARLLHISTDCVFTGDRGMYREEDTPDAIDLYGTTKLLGEVTNQSHCVTLRTSIIGHELTGKRGLLEWFLDQEGSIKGFTKAVFSGFPTVELSRIIADYILQKQDLSGLLHVSSSAISKYDLLKLVAEEYGRSVEIEPCDNPQVDRSLDSNRFRTLTGYRPPSWPEMVAAMRRENNTVSRKNEDESYEHFRR